MLNRIYSVALIPSLLSPRTHSTAEPRPSTSTETTNNSTGTTQHTRQMRHTQHTRQKKNHNTYIIQYRLTFRDF